MDYRPGKRMGAASWAHRAGAGDIIGWYAPQEPEPPRKAVPPSSETLPPPAPTILAPPVSTLSERSSVPAQKGVAVPEKPPVVTDFPTSPVGGQIGRPRTQQGRFDVISSPTDASTGIHPEDVPIHVRRASAMMIASPRLVGPDEPRPGTGGYASQLSLRASYEAISSLPQSVDVWDAPVRQRSALPSAEAVSKAALDGRDDFLKVLASRRSEIKVIRHIWSQRGACAALSHIGKLRNLSIAVDVLQAIAGVGFPKWPQFVDLDWLVELTPVLVSLLQSDYEDYILVGLNAVGSLVPGLQPLISAMGQGQAPDRTRQRPSDLVIVAIYCTQSLISPLNELTDFDGRLGKLAKARLVAINSFMEQAMD